MLNRVFWLFASLFLSPLALAANNDVDLGSPGDGPWVMAPKSGSAAVAWIARVCVGGIALFNLALLLAWYQGF